MDKVAKDEKDEKLILLRFHATGSLGQEGRIQIDLDPVPKPVDLSEDYPPEWAKEDADRFMMILNGYLPSVTVQLIIDAILHKVSTKCLLQEIERRV